MSDKCAALRKGDRWDFIHNDVPKCPHCGEDFDVDNNEAWEVYDLSKDDHDVTCPDCDKDFRIEVYAKFKFSTDNQDHDDE